MSLLKSIVTVIAVIMLAGCVTTIPDQTYSALSSVKVSAKEGRAEQLFQKEMNRLIKPDDTNRYDLSVQISSSRGSNSMAMTINYTLYDQSQGKIVVKKSVSSSASIGAVSSEFGEEQAFIHAEERLSINLAQKIYQRLMVYFGQQHQAS